MFGVSWVHTFNMLEPIKIKALMFHKMPLYMNVYLTNGCERAPQRLVKANVNCWTFVL